MTIRRKFAFKAFGVFTALLAISYIPTSAQTGKMPADPGVRSGASGAGAPLKGLTADETAFFRDGLVRFAEVESVTGGTNNGLGPRFNSNQCLSCHAQPAPGGSSPQQNPMVNVATLNGAKNVVPWFVAPNGPVREARFKRNPNGTNDGEVHDLFVISGRSDAPGCNIAQPSFLPAGNPLTGQGGNPNIIFRISTPVFGAGLIEGIPDSAILANMNADSAMKTEMGISGHANAHRAAMRTSAPTTGRLRASDGKRKTSLCSCSRARPTTSRWGSRMNSFHKSGTRLPAAYSTPHRRIHSTLRLPPRLPAPVRPPFRTSRHFPTLCGCWPRPLRRPTLLQS